MYLPCVQSDSLGEEKSGEKPARENIEMTRDKIENTLQQLASHIASFNERVNEFPVVQYDHFYTIRNDIDIRRETVLQEASSAQDVHSVDLGS